MSRGLVERARKLIEVLTLEANPLRFAAQHLMRRSILGDVLPFRWRMHFGGMPRANYAYCMYRGAELAAALGIDRISVLEFGVAGGNGLVNLEAHARQIEKLCAVKFDVYGFDMGNGLPHSDDICDLPFRWREGMYPMDRRALEARITSAILVLGQVRRTLDEFVRHVPAPVAAVAFDLDYYTSTRDALGVLDIAAEHRLPRIACYFDDITDTIDDIGVLRAIGEFNSEHPSQRLGQLRGNLPGFRIQPPWKDCIYEFHDLKHPLYGKPDSRRAGMLPLASRRPQ